jgi:hypothetical protein
MPFGYTIPYPEAFKGVPLDKSYPTQPSLNVKYGYHPNPVINNAEVKERLDTDMKKYQKLASENSSQVRPGLVSNWVLSRNSIAYAS